MSSKNLTHNLLTAFPHAVLAFSKHIYNKQHVVIFDLRPSILTIEFRKFDDLYHVIVPFDFSPEILYRHFLWRTFVDICLFGNVVFDNEGRERNIKLFLTIWLRRIYKKRDSKLKALNRVKFFQEYLSEMNDVSRDDFTSIVNDLIKTSFLPLGLVDINHLGTQLNFHKPAWAKQFVSAYHTKSWLKFENVFLEIFITNAHLYRSDNMFFYIPVQSDYDELLDLLFKTCSEETDYLQKHCGLYIWLDDLQNLILKLDSNKRNNQTLERLKSIDSKLRNFARRRIISPPNYELSRVREAYNFENLIFGELEFEMQNITRYRLKDHFRSEKGTIFLLEVILGEIFGEIEKRQVSSLIEYLSLYFKLKYYSLDPVKRFGIFEKKIYRLESDLKIHSDFYQIFISNGWKITAKEYKEIKSIVRLFFRLVRSYCNKSSVDRLVIDEHDLILYSLKLSDSDRFLHHQIRLLIEKITRQFGVQTETTILAIMAAAEKQNIRYQ